VFFYDGEIDDHLFDLATCTMAEIQLNAEYTESYACREPIIRVDYLKMIPFEGNLIYLRYEPNLEGHYPNVRFSQLLSESDHPYGFLLLDMQNALLAKVTPALRCVAVTINMEEKSIDLYFWYDGKISDQEYQLATRAAQGGVVSFPHFFQRTHIERIDFPQRLPEDGERAVYVRYEERSLWLD
jgi:hypothetical protein